MKTRKSYSKEFKLDAVSLVTEQNYKIAEAARSLGISANMLGRWLKEQESEGAHAFRGNGKLTPEQEEIRQLRAENKRLKMEKEIPKKGDGLLCQRNQVKYGFITQHKKTWPISLMCQVLGVSRRNYYSAVRRNEQLEPDPQHDELIEWVQKIADASDFTYGVRRMKRALNSLGYPVGKQRTRALMKEADVSVRRRRKYKVTTNSDHQQPVFDNVLSRDFDAQKPDQAYVSDITYIWTQEGWLYLAVVIDLFSRKVVGWSMSSRMSAQLVCDALTMALWQRKPKAGLIHHSDRGSQYASRQFRQLLAQYKVTGSMSRKGDCWDNAVVESFFGTLKQERVQWRHYQSRHAAQQDILQYITMFYNSQRMHSYLDYKSPNQYEADMANLGKAA
ncbi:IS3 family transposase [Alteromonas sp. B31-7]|uniref:IS3 family transposase n=3 Tax=Alteromonas TaxID=226 RepID=UPI0018C92DC0|nr:IS3 family transposase [Alteromonas sp. B31-7]QPL48862.1 IS3 family transposase [Alteromonas sp. B31-7]QPL49280.1 IS3 family transposase [Alteromonas sp. B31-7]QPL50370.1 IS3 family transposase [Alteromonas sp. B31-7]QPL50375.1 IS3 family transposase [Alteromonas sp. B31-7]